MSTGLGGSSQATRVRRTPTSGGGRYPALVLAVLSAAVLATGTLWVLAAPSAGSGGCGVAVDADGLSEVAAEAELRAALDPTAAALVGCAEWHVEVDGQFELTDTLAWTSDVPLRISGPVVGGGPGLARLTAVPGVGATLVEHRILTVEAATLSGVGEVALERLVLTGGDVSLVSGPTLGEYGGAVLADVVRLVDVELVGNKAVVGGAVSALDVHATRTSFVENAAITAGSLDGEGGAIAAEGDVTLVNVTFVGNRANRGGAVHMFADSALDATFVTFRHNEAVAPGGADIHRDIAFSGGTVALRGVLFGGTVAGPACGGGLGSGFPILEPAFSDGGSFATDPSCSDAPVVTGLTFATVPFPYGTRALVVLDDAPDALGAVPCDPDDGWPAVDQRGVTRPQGDACDAGAVEREVVEVVVPDPPVTDDPPHVDDGDVEVVPDPPVTVEEPTDPEVATDPVTEGAAGPAPVVGGPVPTSVPAGDGMCADGCPALSLR